VNRWNAELLSRPQHRAPVGTSTPEAGSERSTHEVQTPTAPSEYAARYDVREERIAACNAERERILDAKRAAVLARKPHEKQRLRKLGEYMRHRMQHTVADVRT